MTRGAFEVSRIGFYGLRLLAFRSITNKAIRKDIMEDEVTLSTAAKWIVVIFIGGLVIGGIILAWVNILGPAFNQANYNLYNNSSQHLQAVAQKFSDDCLQLASTSDPVARKAIEQDINLNAATVDLNKVDMPDSTRTCVNKAMKDVNHQ